MNATQYTHEQFIGDVRKYAIERLNKESQHELAQRLANVKLVYGRGQPGLRGVTCHNAWAQGEQQLTLAEICAMGEQSQTQLAGTTLHELAHVIAGPGHGHDKVWKDACKLLGLRKCNAAGQVYTPAVFDPSARQVIHACPQCTDGKPVSAGDAMSIGMIAMKPCSAGIGTRGGKSRGVGSGSRMLKYVCDCGCIIRAATQDLHASCDDCGTSFKRA